MSNKKAILTLTMIAMFLTGGCGPKKLAPTVKPVVSPRSHPKSFNDAWRFAKGQLPGAEAVDFDDASWQPVHLPHDWAVSGPFNPDENGYAAKLPWKGVGWYRKTFTLAPADKGKRLYFDFDGVMAAPSVYVNGHLAGDWDYGYMAFRVDATDFVRFDAPNVIAVKADTTRHGTRWYPGAGIYRSVTMTVSDHIHIAHWGTCITTPVVTDDKATITVTTAIENHTDNSRSVTLTVDLFDPDGRPVAHGTADAVASPAAETQLQQTFTVPRPQRWDVTDPQLYTAGTTLTGKAGILDENLTTFGIRTFEFTADDGFHLNGRRLQLYGVNLHHDQGSLGAAFYARAAQRQFEIMKDMGCNALRTSHNPPAAELLDICDRMGIVVWNECFDKWNETSDRPADIDLVDYNKKQLRSFILRDRNHPSVFTWSIGNEIADIESNRSGHAHEQVAQLADFVRSMDPTRPVGMGCYIPSAVGTGVLGSLDLTGWNYARRYAPYREKYPDKPIVYTESASALSTRGFYKLPLPIAKADYATDDLQVDSYDLNAAPWSDIPDKEFKLMTDDTFVAGEFVWTGFDYLGEPTPFGQQARSSYFGIVDLCGIPKDRYYLYRAHWRPDTTTVHIVGHWNWSEMTGKTVPVFVYTNGDSAELFLNGKSLGKRTKGPAPKRPENFALYATASASSQQSDKGNLVALACDGDNSTRWCAADDSAAQWFQLDLGATRQIRCIAVEFENEQRNYGYDLKTSPDGQTWNTLLTKQTSTQPQRADTTHIFHDVDTAARFVRIDFTRLSPRTWASIRELAVYPEKTESDYYDVTHRYRLRWNEVPFEQGTVQAIAYKDGVPIGADIIHTAGDPASVRLTPDRTRLSADGHDLSYILVEVLDKDGTPCPLVDDLVRFKVDGPGEIAGVGNGNPLSLEPFQADTRRLFNGKAMLIIKTRPDQPGTIRVTAESENLYPTTVNLKTQKQ